MGSGIARERYDVVIAGARVAGSATAMLLARSGARVLVVDPLPRGRDTLSTHALMRGGVLQLLRWGLLDRLLAAGTPPVTRTTFDYGDEVLPIAIKPKHGVEALYAPRRTVLDPLLEDAALEAGAEVVRGLRMAALSRDAGGRVRGAWLQSPDRAIRVEADLVVGADGIRSDVAAMVGAATERSAPGAAAAIYGYFEGLPTDGYVWSFRPGVGAALIPTDDGLTCACVNVAPEWLRGAGSGGLEALCREVWRTVDPRVAEALDAGRRVGSLRAFPGTPGFVRTAAGPGWALVGDAGWFRDPLTAHGITDAFRDAELLARALMADQAGGAGLAAYGAARDPLAGELLDVTGAVAALDWSIDRVKALHHRLNRAMNAGVAALLELDAGPAGRARAARLQQPVALASR